jgi:hypothetical protein
VPILRSPTENLIAVTRPVRIATWVIRDSVISDLGFGIDLICVANPERSRPRAIKFHALAGVPGS